MSGIRAVRSVSIKDEDAGFPPLSHRSGTSTERSDDADDAYDAEGTEEDGGTEEDADDSAAAKLRLEAEQSRLKAEKRTEKMRKAQRETVQLKTTI